MLIHDVLGVGFGPSNLALAIALDEHRHNGHRIDAMFIERQPAFSWHPHMLLAQSHMQVSFLKDLATLRNPTSRFTFVNYLHEKQRLPDFINLKTFYPSRHEFNDYLGWAAAQFDDRCAYGETVFEVLPERQGREVAALRVRSRDEAGQLRERITRNLVIGLGGAPRIPPAFEALAGDARVFHSHSYLRDIAQHPQARKIAVIGAGQSAAEIFMNLHGLPSAPQVDMIMRARAIKPSDDSPFVNEIFNAEFVDHIHAQPEAERQALLEEFRHTNYACPDLALIQQIYEVFYQQKLREEPRHRMLCRHEIQSARATDQGIQLSLLDVNAGREFTVRYDAVVLATGYEREHHKALLAPLTHYLSGLQADRQYRLRSTPEFRPAIFLQGACEASHGLSDTLLSITAVRTGEIGAALLRKLHTPQREPVQPC